MDYRVLPDINAGLNTLCTVLLVSGYVLVKKRRLTAHKICMLAAFTVSLLFLTSYLIYHAQVGSVKFPGTGVVRTVYLGILLTHTILAALVPPLALYTLVLGLRNRRERHRKVARWTLPLWLYVSVTGVVIYAMLYHGNFG